MAAKKSLSFALEPRATATIDDYVADCVWSPDSKSFAIAGGEGKVALARAEAGSLVVNVLGEHLLGTLGIAWRPHAKAFNAQPGRVDPHLPAARDGRAGE